MRVHQPTRGDFWFGSLARPFGGQLFQLIYLSRKLVHKASVRYDRSQSSEKFGQLFLLPGCVFFQELLFSGNQKAPLTIFSVDHTLLDDLHDIRVLPQ